jgi:hypothetical protein
MLLFILITVLFVTAVLLRLTFLRFERTVSAGEKTRAPFSASAYGKWLAGRMAAAFSREALDKGRDIFRAWTKDHYPGPLKWIFIGFGASLAYLVATGFFFAFFIGRGMFGLPLLGHVMFGGLFAASLALLLIWRGRAYRPDKDEAAVFESFACPVFKNFSGTRLRIILFWTFAAFGLVQVATALGSMLPVFTFETQQALVTVHRYSALALLLTAIVFIDLAVIPRRRP